MTEPLTDAIATRRVASTGGVSIAVHELGGDGPVLLLAHATGFHGRVWLPVAAHLRDFRVVAPDLRGHGDSTLPEGFDPDVPGALAWAGFADDVLAVVDDLGDDARPLVAAGHSKGGAALLLAEQRRPGTFAALYCFEPIVFPPFEGSAEVAELPDHPMAVAALRRRTTFPSHEAAVANFAAKPPLDALDPAALEAYVRHGFAAGGDGTVELKCRPAVEAQVYRMGGHHDGFANLAEVRCPVTVAMGADPGGFSPSMFAPAIAEALPAGRLERHDDLGHFGPLEDPARIAAAIREAVRRQR